MHLKEGTLLHNGTYRIVRFIQSGGFGCTYEGEHILLQKKIAIKEFFIADFCNRDEDTKTISVGVKTKITFVEKLKAKFIEEARAVSKLEHPGIVNVYDVFEENGTAYYVMDYIDGPSLNDLVKDSKRLPEKQVVKYIKQVAEALEYVHKQKRLHLDVKPANIMLANEGQRAVLIDFGASKQYTEKGGNTSTLVGRTPGYAPIEQMDNNVAKFLPATDIYALGATMYKLLTGNTPISANRISSGELLDPLPETISEPVRNAVRSAMIIKKHERTQSIRDFLDIMQGKKDVTEIIGKDDVDVVEVTPGNGNPPPNPVPKKKYWRYGIVSALISFVVVIVGVLIYNNLSSYPGDYGGVDTAIADSAIVDADRIQNIKVENERVKLADGTEVRYTGEVNENYMPNGKGTAYYDTGDVYKGEYKNGYMNGFGTFDIQSSAQKFIGTFEKDDLIKGKIINKDGSYFEGELNKSVPWNGAWYSKGGAVVSKVTNGK